MDSTKKAYEITKYARELKEFYNTDDPYELAKIYGITVIEIEPCFKDFKAQTLKIEGFPTTISINRDYSDRSKRILCAHELGHALLHNDHINHFATTSKNLTTNVETEANLFAIALLSDNDINDQLDLPLESMNNYLLKSIIDYNLC